MFQGPEGRERRLPAVRGGPARHGADPPKGARALGEVLREGPSEQSY